MNNHPHKYVLYAFIVYCLFIIYCTLIPFDFVFSWEIVKWRLKKQFHIPFVYGNGQYASIRDIVQNIVFFMPFGFLFYFLAQRIRWNFILACISGFMLSFFVEILQLFTRNRYTSINDLITNTLGTVLGFYIARSMVKIQYKSMNIDWVTKIYKNKVYLLCLLCWFWVILTNFSPYDINFSLIERVKLLRQDFFTFSVIQDEVNQLVQYLLCTFLTLRCISLYRSDLEPEHKTKYSYFIVFVFILCSFAAICFEMAQIVIHSRSAQFQDIVFRCIGILLATVYFKFFYSKSHQTTREYFAVFLICFAFVIYTISPFQFSKNYLGFSWLPFSLEYSSSLFGIWVDFLYHVLLLLPLGFIIALQKNSNRVTLYYFLFFLFLEYSQGWVVGRYGNITDVISSIIGIILGKFIYNSQKFDSIANSRNGVP